jgi:Integrase zinc binding domain
MEVNPRGALFDLDSRGLFIRIAPRNGTRQIFVPRGLIRRIMVNEHYPDPAGHPGAHRMFLSLRRAYFWPGMAADVYETVKRCDACARNRINERRKTNPLKLFPAKGPLESVAMDILGPSTQVQARESLPPRYYWYIRSELGQPQSDNFQTEVESDFI